MRRILIRSAILIAAFAALSLLWIFAGRSLSLLLDRVGTAKMESRTIDQVIFEGGEPGGTFKFAGLALIVQDRDYKPFLLGFGSDAQDQFMLTAYHKTFPLGPFSMDGPVLHFSPALGDEASIEVRRSLLSWPTPFDLNFMSGHSPSWKRNLYYVLDWRKASGRRLEMVWRYEQYFYPVDGWASGFMTREGATGLMRVKISP